MICENRIGVGALERTFIFLVVLVSLRMYKFSFDYVGISLFFFIFVYLVLFSMRENFGNSVLFGFFFINLFRFFINFFVLF